MLPPSRDGRHQVTNSSPDRHLCRPPPLCINAPHPPSTHIDASSEPAGTSSCFAIASCTPLQLISCAASNRVHRSSMNRFGLGLIHLQSDRPALDIRIPVPSLSTLFQQTRSPDNARRVICYRPIATPKSTKKRGSHLYRSFRLSLLLLFLSVAPWK